MDIRIGMRAPEPLSGAVLNEQSGVDLQMVEPARCEIDAKKLTTS